MEENFDKVFIENEHTELKKSTSLINEALISIVSILNKHGKGQLFFGIKVKFELTNTGFTTVFYRDNIFNSQIEKDINNSASEKDNFGTISERFRKRCY